MANFNINPQEESKLKKCRMFFNRGFLVSITDKNNDLILSPYMISNFSIDDKKIFITVYDIIQEDNIERKFDSLLKGFWVFKPKVKITLIKLNAENEEVYSITYNKCRLKKYHGKNFTYKGNDPHQWYLEFSYNTKTIVKNDKYNFSKYSDEFKEINADCKPIDDKEISKKEIEILKNSNKMLEEAAEKVRSTRKLNSRQKDEKITEINNPKNENKKMVNNIYGSQFKDFNLNELEKKLEKQISDLENKKYK